MRKIWKRRQLQSWSLSKVDFFISEDITVFDNGIELTRNERDKFTILVNVEQEFMRALQGAKQGYDQEVLVDS